MDLIQYFKKSQYESQFPVPDFWVRPSPRHDVQATTTLEMGFVECIVMQMTMRAHDSDGGYKHHSTRAAEFLRAGLREGGWMKGWDLLSYSFAEDACICCCNLHDMASLGPWSH